MYENLAKKYYKESSFLNKAVAAGKAIDNALELKYSKGGATKTYFMMDNYLKYFTYEKIINIKKHKL